MPRFQLTYDHRLVQDTGDIGIATGVGVPRSSPHELTPAEVAAIRDLVTAPDYRHVPTCRLAILAQRLGIVFVSATAPGVVGLSLTAGVTVQDTALSPSG